MLALALPLTLFMATTMPSARFWPPCSPVVLLPPLPPLPLLVEALVVLVIVEVMLDLSSALTVSRPLALITVSSILAVALDGFSPPKASSGSPSSVSIVSNRTFPAFQPTVLKASVTPIAVPPLLPPVPPLLEDVVVAAFFVVAVKVAVFSASTVTAPAPVPVVVTWLLLSVAVAALCTMLAPIRPPTASCELVVPPVLPLLLLVPLLEDGGPAVNSLVMFAVMVAVSFACTRMLPPLAVSVVASTRALAPPLTSLIDRAAPTPVVLPLVVKEDPSVTVAVMPA